MFMFSAFSSMVLYMDSCRIAVIRVLRGKNHVSKPFFLEKPKRSWITMDSYDSGGEIEPFDFQGLGCTIVVRISLCFVTSRISTFGLYRFI